jgi:hypothetical protein
MPPTMDLEPPPPPNFRSPAWGWTKATRALTVLVLVFALYLIVGETPATHGAVYDDDGFDAIDDFRGAVLDGGSGKAALTVYECTLDSHGCAPGSVKSKQLSRAKADAVAAVRAADLSQLVTTATPPLSIGLTGGVRAAMARGDLARPDVDRFFASIKRPTRTLKVLSGADEARLERRGGGYCAHAALGVHSDRVGTMGSGGATMQLAAPGDGDVASLSTDLLGIEDRAAATGDEAALREWRDDIDAQLRTVDVHGFEGAELVFAMSMHASAAALAGVDGRRVMRKVADIALQGLVGAASAPGPAWDAVGAPNPYHLDPELLRRATLFNAARTRSVVEALPEGTNFYFARQVGDVSCDWSLGLFLEDAAAAAADRSS